ncbi:MBL fold metallo-hydrolase [Conexibacter sp. CPCC 206217]|uniref:MBL fold metallo-hydrolase n=1 Tax=Conexibacter sp. CPCC 206217 TaxID=3064574 RepID=UPI00271E76FC|nr:MBL fold metallo-hydrolase [Conexibacter sp. CPCC 206217]MDO8208778.1 MBL fold metallo-hydrolase [Conexibacter sp. CPCC 206217]
MEETVKTPERRPYEIAPGIWRRDLPLAPGITVAVHVVRGPLGAVLVDTGSAGDHEAVLELLEAAGVRPRDVRVVLDTHKHHDHIGGNRQAKERTGALLAAPAGAVAWIEDHERHLREFAEHHPELLLPTAQERAELAATLDGEVAVELIAGEGFTLRLGDGIELRALALPGHVEDEIGLVERRSGALLIADAVPNVDWPLFHGHVEPAVLRATLARLRGLAHAARGPVSLAHRPVTDGAGLRETIAACEAFVDAVDEQLRAQLRAAGEQSCTLGQLWESACETFGRAREFRGLAMVDAHLRGLSADGLIARTAPDTYRWIAPRA